MLCRFATVNVKQDFQIVVVMKREDLRIIMNLAWRFVKRNGYTMSEALRVAWCNFKLKARMRKGIVKFYFQKVDGSVREAFGTLSPRIAPVPLGTGRRTNDTVQNYYDTEKGDWRCYKIANLLKIA